MVISVSLLAPCSVACGLSASSQGHLKIRAEHDSSASYADDIY